MNQLNTIISGIFTAADQLVAGFFDGLIDIGVRHDAVVIIIIGVGFSLFLLIILGIVGEVKNAQKSPKPQEIAKPQALIKDNASKTIGVNQGFAIYKKDKTKSRDVQTSTTQFQDPVLAALADIERDMLALKELYETGHINADLYISETRKLYDRAQQHR